MGILTSTPTTLDNMDLEGTTQPLQDQPQTANDPTPHPGPSYAPNTSDHTVIAGGNSTPPQTSSERQVPNIPSEAHLTLLHTQSEHFERVSGPRHARSHDAHVRMSARRTTFNGGLPAARLDASEIDWIVPVDEKRSAYLTVRDRLQPTIDNAVKERNRYAHKVFVTGWVLNIMIGLQILLGALTTAIAAAVTSVKQAQTSTAILGALSTLVASYLARARGSGEPDLSILRVKDLDQFLRTAEDFQLDHGHKYPDSENRLGDEVEHLRHLFEELLGNASGARKLSPVGIAPAQTSPA